MLLLTSDPYTIEEVTTIAGNNFEHLTVLFWQVGDVASKPDVLRQICATDYNLIVSYVNGIILKRGHLEKATYGAINLHPAPPEHGGTWGTWCQPVIRRDVRTHHGVTVHEVDEKIDHGRIYRAKRWEVDANATIQSVMLHSFAECLQIFKEVTADLGKSTNGTQCLLTTDEHWHLTNRGHTVKDVRKWFEALDPGHPAHNERVIFNHPRAIIHPPYFDDT